MVAGHAHFSRVAVGVLEVADDARNVGCAEVELRAIVCKERSMTAALVFGKDINLSFELRVRMNRAGLCNNLTAFNFFTVNAAQKNTDVIAGNRAVEELAEHFDTRRNSLARLVTKTDNLNRLVEFQHAALNTTCGNRAASRDCEDVFNRHKERFIGVACGSRNVIVDSVKQREDIFLLLFVAFESQQSRTCDNGNVVAGEFILAQKFANFHFDEFKQFGVVDLVNFVEENDDSGNTDLAGKKDMFTSLRHGAVGSSNNEDCAVHLRRAGDHVFDIVGVTGAVDVSIVTFFGLVLNVRSVDCNAAFAFFRSLVDVFIGFIFCETLFRKNLGDSGSQRGFAVVDVTDCADVYVGFTAVKFLLCHLNKHSLILKNFF